MQTEKVLTMWIMKVKFCFSRFNLESTDLIPDQLRGLINHPVFYNPTAVFHSQFFVHSEDLRAGLMSSLLDLLRPATEDKQKFH